MTRTKTAIAEVTAAEAENSAYVRGMLEGGSGYNPHEARRQAAFEALANAERLDLIEDHEDRWIDIKRTWNKTIRAGNGSFADVTAAEKATGLTKTEVLILKEALG